MGWVACAPRSRCCWDVCCRLVDCPSPAAVLTTGSRSFLTHAYPPISLQVGVLSFDGDSSRDAPSVGALQQHTSGMLHPAQQLQQPAAVGRWASRDVYVWRGRLVVVDDEEKAQPLTMR